MSDFALEWIIKTPVFGQLRDMSGHQFHASELEMHEQAEILKANVKCATDHLLPAGEWHHACHWRLEQRRSHIVSSRASIIRLSTDRCWPLVNCLLSSDTQYITYCVSGGASEGCMYITQKYKRSSGENGT